jgi:hypothetical protein
VGWMKQAPSTSARSSGRRRSSGWD